MFSDNKRNKTTGEIGSGQPNRIEKSTKIKGEIESQADFRIDGILEGTIKTSGKIIVGKDGKITGKVECSNAEIEGNFSGELYVSQLLTLKSTATIDGDVTVSKLAVDPGATFNAACNMQGKAGGMQKRTHNNDQPKQVAQAKS